MSNDARYDRAMRQKREAGHMEATKSPFMTGMSKAELRAIAARAAREVTITRCPTKAPRERGLLPASNFQRGSLVTRIMRESV